jgi:hypothetical protein
VTLVVDASVAAKWFVREDLYDEAAELLEHLDQLCSVDLLVLEVTNIAWKKLMLGAIPPAQAADMAKGIRASVPLLYPSGLFNERALELASKLRHSIYDCLYLACAEALDAALVTADHQFGRKAQASGLGKFVIALGSRPISAIIGR